MSSCNQSNSEVHLGRFAASAQPLKAVCQLQHLQCLIVGVSRRRYVGDHTHSTCRTAQTFFDQLRQLAFPNHKQ